MLTQVKDDKGQAMQGVVIKDPTKKFRTLTQKCCTEAMWSEQFLGKQQQLRKGQGAEVFNWLNKKTVDLPGKIP
eukprot:9651321-Lingulodinium_polyedra.AAC.1